MGYVIQDSIEIAADTSNLRNVREFMSRLVGKSGLDERDRNKVILAVDEAVANIVKHAYGEREEGWVRIDVHAGEEKFEIVIRDSGSTFNPDSISEPDMKEHIRLGKKTGLGIFLMRQIMDEVNYAFLEGRKNRLHLVKYLRNPS